MGKMNLSAGLFSVNFYYKANNKMNSD